MFFKKKEPKVGDVRSITKFVIFPKTLSIGGSFNNEERRFLVKCGVFQEYKSTLVISRFRKKIKYKTGWQDLYWSRKLAK